MKLALQFPKDVKRFCSRKYVNQRQQWLQGAGIWPLEVFLGSPTEAQVQSQGDAVREWASVWHEWRGPGTLAWRERRWRTIGSQTLPESLALAEPLSVATLIGEQQEWNRVQNRYASTVSRWPVLADHLARQFNELSSYSDQDMVLLEALLTWIQSNPSSNLYPRQIPVVGMDTKWLEPRIPFLADLVATLQGGDRGNLGFHERCGLKETPSLIKLRLLDPALRDRVGGLSYIAAPISDIATLRLSASRVYIVENVQSGLCFGDRPGSVVFLGLGYGVGSLQQVPWITAAECLYWGDLDTHGFAILNRARAALPHLSSVLMDESTLWKYRDQWVQECNPHSLVLPFLSSTERAVYEGLRTHRWGTNIRLEQERIPWDDAWQVLHSAPNIT